MNTFKLCIVKFTIHVPTNWNESRVDKVSAEIEILNKKIENAYRNALLEIDSDLLLESDL